MQHNFMIPTQYSIYYRIQLLLLLFTLGLTTSLFSQIDLDSGLVAYYPFTGNANDSSGNNNHGTVVGAILTTDRFADSNSAYYFDGINDEITIPHDSTLQFLSQQSLAGWIYIDSPALPTITLVSKGSEIDNGSCRIWLFRQPDYTYIPSYGIERWPFPNTEITSNTKLSLRTWYHICCTSGDGIALKLYINGRLDTLLNTANVNIGNLENLFIGHISNSNNHHGKIDEVRIYNRILDECEVWELYRSWQASQAVLMSSDTICANESATIGIIYSDTSKTYHLEDTLTGNQIGIILNGNNDSIFLSTSALTSTTTLRIVETQKATGCQRIIDTTFTITVLPQPSKPSISLVGIDSLKCSIAGASYQWFFNDTLLVDITQTIFAAQYGKYRVIIMDNTCQSDTSAEYDYSEIGIRKTIINQDIVIYPNPNDGSFTIEIENTNGKQVHIKIYDVLGTLVFEKDIQGNQAINKVHVAKINKGIFFGRLQIGECIINRKISVQ